jgi:hypothetical protein
MPTGVGIDFVRSPASSLNLGKSNDDVSGFGKSGMGISPDDARQIVAFECRNDTLSVEWSFLH